MAGDARTALVCLLGTCATFGLQAATARGDDPPGSVARRAQANQDGKELKDWLEQYSQKMIDGSKLVITVVTNEEKAKEKERQGFDLGVSTYHCYVSSSGAVSHRSFTPFGSKGSSGITIA